MSEPCISGGNDEFCLSERTLILLIAGIILTIGNFYNYYRLAIFEKQESVMQYARVQILNLRLAAIVPLFSFILIFSISFPSGVFVLEALEALVEGYCLYCFYKMLAIFCGTSENIEEAISNFGRDPNYPHRSDMATVIFICCKPCIESLQDRSPSWYHQCIKTLSIQFFCLRPIFVLLAGIFEIKAGYQRNPATVAFIALYIVSLVATMAAILRFYHITQHLTKSLYPAKKFIFIKAIILVIVIQNIIVNQGFIHRKSHREAIEVQRIYAFVVIVELFFLSIFLPRIFASKFEDYSTIAQTQLTVDDIILRKIVIHESFPSFALRICKLYLYSFDRDYSSSDHHFQPITPGSSPGTGTAGGVSREIVVGSRNSMDNLNSCA